MGTMFLGHLSCDHLGLGGHQGLAHLARSLVAFLLRYLHRGGDGDIGALLDWDVDTLLTLHLEGDGDTLLLRNIFTQLLGVMTPCTVLEVHNPALYILDCLALLLVGGGDCGVTTENERSLIYLGLYRYQSFLVSKAATH